MNPRHALLRQMQQFFETYLMGVARWDSVEHIEPVKVERASLKTTSDIKAYRERNVFGKHHEVASVAFMGLLLTVESPNEKPPLGQITLSGPRGILAFGPIDDRTWFEVAKAITFNPPSEEHHGSEHSRHYA